jgi:isoleucyl-tRNA synthetase
VIDAANSFKSAILILMNAKDVVTTDKPPEGENASQMFEGGIVHISKKIDQELYEEGILNEIKRRVQVMRKELGLIESDKVELHISSEKAIEDIVEQSRERLSREVNAKKLLLEPGEEMGEYKIDGRLVRISIKK